MVLMRPESELVTRIEREPTDPVPNSPLRVRYILIGAKGAVHFLYMDWPDRPRDHGLADVEARWEQRTGHPMYPMAMDVGQHSIVDDDGYRTDCDVVAQGYCYYSGSTLYAERVMMAWRDNGMTDVWVFEFLARHYFSVFYELDDDNT